MTTARRNLKVNEVSLCRSPANPASRVALFKSEDDLAPTPTDEKKFVEKLVTAKPIATTDPKIPIAHPRLLSDAK